jgi:hypothetical protein
MHTEIFGLNPNYLSTLGAESRGARSKDAQYILAFAEDFEPFGEPTKRQAVARHKLAANLRKAPSAKSNPEER